MSGRRVHYRPDGWLAVNPPIGASELAGLRWIVPRESRRYDPRSKELLIAPGWAVFAIESLQAFGEVEIGGAA